MPRNAQDARIPSTKRSFLELKKQELLRRFKDPKGREKNAVCINCGATDAKAFLFPICRMVHSFVCEDCIPETLRSRDRCKNPWCEYDDILEIEYEKTIEQHRLEWIGADGTIIVRPLDIDLLTLAIPELQTETILLNKGTVVFLGNIELSGALFFKLLTKTKVLVGENVSVFECFKGEDCIRAGMDDGMPNSNRKPVKEEKLEPESFAVVFFPNLAVYGGYEVVKFHLAAGEEIYFSKITRAERNSIWFGKVRKLELWKNSVNILPKLSLHEENEMEVLRLNAYQIKHVSDIIKTKNNSIKLGKVKSLELKSFAVNILPKLSLHGDNVMEKFHLSAEKTEHVSEVIRAENNSIKLGKVKKLELWKRSINILPKLSLHEENEMEVLSLNTEKMEYVSDIIKTKNNSIKLGKIKSLELKSFAVNILPKLSLHKDNVMEKFHLSAEKTEHVSEVIRAESNSIKLGKVKKLELWKRSINTLPKLSLDEENEMEVLSLNAEKMEYISEVMGVENNSIKLRKIKKLELKSFAVNILPKLSPHEENVIEIIQLSAERMEQVSDTIKTPNNNIIGKVKYLVLIGYAINILPRLVLHEENVIEKVLLGIDGKEYTPEIFEKRNIKLGNMKELELCNYAVNNILPKMVLHEESVLEVFFLNAPSAEHVSDIVCAENNSIMLGNIKKLGLRFFAVNILPKLSLHGKNMVETFFLYAERMEHVSEIIKTKNNSIKLGKVKKLELRNYAVNTLPKLGMHEENVMEILQLSAERMEQVSDVIRAENNSIKLEKVKKLELCLYANKILPKIVLHEENVMEILHLSAEKTEHVSEIIKAKINSIRLGKINNLELRNYAANILPKLSLHGENAMERVCLSAERMEQVSGVIRAENNSIKLEKINNLELRNYAANILPKLSLHGENAMEMFYLNAEKTEHVSEIAKTKNNSIKLGKVKKLELKVFGINILPKLVLHEENVMEEFRLNGWTIGHVSGIMSVENNSIRLGKIKNLKLMNYAISILTKLVLHGENVMESFFMSAERFQYVSEVLWSKNSSIFLGKVKKLELCLYANKILPKLVLHEENVMEEFCLNGWTIKHVSEIIKAKSNSIRLGKIKNLELRNYAINVLTKLVLDVENVMKRVFMSAGNLENVSEVIWSENSSIFLGKVKKLELCLYAINILPKLVLHEENVVEEFRLNGWNIEHVSGIMSVENSSIYWGTTKKLELKSFAVNILHKLRLHALEVLYLNAEKKEHVYRISRMENSSIKLGKIKKLELKSFAINILPKLSLHGENVMEELSIVDVDRESFETAPLSERDCCLWEIKRLRVKNSAVDVLRIRTGKSCVLNFFEFIPRKEESFSYPPKVDVGKIKQKGFLVPEEIKPFLEYTLVDEKGNEVVDKKEF
ncbi:MAG: uncharacterized protein A8A55_2109 [Amphiamblys sp. WSBS2006]|nr:MAG: uncharacterized protein A8A55_2109 [Amphiamblys sp. WSBS2006]